MIFSNSLRTVICITVPFMFWNIWLWTLRIALIPCRGLVQFKLCALLPAIRAPNSAGYQYVHCHSCPIGLSASSSNSCPTLIWTFNRCGHWKIHWLIGERLAKFGCVSVCSLINCILGISMLTVIHSNAGTRWLATHPLAHPLLPWLRAPYSALYHVSTSTPFVVCIPQWPPLLDRHTPWKPSVRSLLGVK